MTLDLSLISTLLSFVIIYQISNDPHLIFKGNRNQKIWSDIWEELYQGNRNIHYFNSLSSLFSLFQAETDVYSEIQNFILIAEFIMNQIDYSGTVENCFGRQSIKKDKGKEQKSITDALEGLRGISKRTLKVLRLLTFSLGSRTVTYRIIKFWNVLVICNLQSQAWEGL